MNPYDFTESGALIAAWAYLGQDILKADLGSRYKALYGQSTTSGFTGVVVWDKFLNVIFYGYAGTDQLKDSIAYYTILGKPIVPDTSIGYSQIADMYVFNNSSNNIIIGDPQFRGSVLASCGQSWGVALAQIASSAYGFIGVGIDGPGAGAYINSNNFLNVNEYFLGDSSVIYYNIPFIKLRGTAISLIGSDSIGTIYGSIFVDKSLPLVMQHNPDYQFKLIREGNYGLYVNPSLTFYGLSYGYDSKDLSSENAVLGGKYSLGNIKKIHITNADKIYFIQNGDTLSEIAEKTGFTVQELADYNGIKDPNKIYAGNKLRIPICSNDNNASIAPDGLTIGVNQYCVDSIFNNPDSIALLTGVSVEEIYWYNSWLIRGAEIPEGIILELPPSANSFNFLSNPNLATELSGADDPISSINFDNSTLFNNGSYIIYGYGDVNTLTGIGSYANSILSDGYRPGAYEISLYHSSLFSEVAYTPYTPSLIGSTSNQLASTSDNLVGTDPLLLDLNGDGVKLTSFGEAPVLFDIDHDGKRELTGWSSSADGIVVMDLNGNGVIEGIHETMSEYFNGTVGKNGDSGTKLYANGFAALKSLDSNGDGMFTIADTAWSNVKVWMDADHDGETDAGELKRLAELGITSINLTSTTQSGLVNGGNEILATGTFVQNSVIKEAQAARFIANPVGNSSTASGSGTIVSAEDGQSTYVSDVTTGETIDVAQKGVLNAYGNSGDDILIGDAHNNWLAGGQGSDIFNAGAGDDMLIIDALDLQANIHAGDGFDMLQVVGSDGVAINLTQVEVEVAVGGKGNDVFIGGGRSSVFVEGGDGDDILIGGAANDALSGQNGADMIDGGGGNDVIRGGRGQDRLMGGSGDDLVEGGVDDDQISGGAGNDVLKGDQGDDALDGGEGTDIAEFSGSFADYRIVKLTDTSYRVTDTHAGRDGADTLTNIEKVNFADVLAVDITLDNPMPVKDVLTIADRNGVKLFKVSNLLANDRDWQGDALHITTVSDIKGGTIAGRYNATTKEWIPTLTVNGELQFTPDPSYTGVMSFKYKIADVDGTPGANVVNLGTNIQAEGRGQVFIKTAEMPTDILFTNEWYLSDINVLPVWKDYSGKGINIGQFEPGMPYSTGAEVFNYRQPDLQANSNRSWIADPNGNIPQTFSEHATLVAGVMVAARNGEGAVGVAYGASLAGYYVGQTLSQSAQNQGLLDFANLYQLKNYDVTNNSWGLTGQFEYFTKSEPNFSTEFFKPAVELGRNGIGTNIVMACGNSRQSGGNTNASELTANRYVIVAGAINAESDISTLSITQKPFSNPGASILVSAPGSNIASTSNIMMNEDGTVFGNDTTSVKGTSFAVPILSGVIALMLEANPNLGYRDVQQILALSARKVDDPNTDNIYNQATNWNGGGMHVSHDYGFGEVDARVAVRLAETWTPQHIAANERHLSNGEGSMYGGANLGVVIADGSTVTRTLNIGSGVCAEHVELTIDVVHNNWNDLTVELISPTGTISRLVANPGQTGLSNPDMQMRQLNFTFDTTHDWGENVEGSWQMRIIDRSGLGSGVLNGWKLDAYGSDLNETANTIVTTGEFPVLSATADNTYFYTDEFTTSSGAKREVLSDTNGGKDILNTSAVSTNSSINLNNGTLSTVAGRSLTISGDIEFALGGDGNDIITGNPLSNYLYGGRGNDTINAGASNDMVDGAQGNDILTGGDGSDFFVIHKETGATTTITDYTPGSIEKILLVGFENIVDFTQLTLIQQNENVCVILENGQRILLQNTAISSVTEQSFGFFSDNLMLTNFRDQISLSSCASLTSGPENMLLPNDRGNLSIFAIGGDDVLGSQTAQDFIDGGDGNDLLWGEYPGYAPISDQDWLEGGAGSDVLYGGGGNDLLRGGSGNDEEYGEADNDVLFGASGDDYLNGGAGNDMIFLEGDLGTVDGSNYGYYGTRVGGSGADIFMVTSNGGANDGFYASGTQFSAYNLIADFDPAQTGEVIDLTNLTWIRGFADLSISTMLVSGVSLARVSASDGIHQLSVNLYGVSASTLNASHFKFISNPGLIFGSSSNNNLTGDAGGNTLDGGAGADTMTGRTGDDTYIVDNTGDIINELPDGGFDTVKANVSYTLPANVENLVLTGSIANNGAGNGEINRITGNASDNVLDGGAGADTMLGGAGNDTYVVDNQSDTVIELSGEGTDLVNASVSYTLGINIENLILTDSETINATGNDLNNTLTGNLSNNILDGAAGTDTMAGGDGNDTYLVENVGDVVIENANQGYDTVYASVNYMLEANVENLVLGAGVVSGNGNALDNWIEGNSAANTLVGGDGNDTLNGNAGADTMIGGAGDDTYLVDNVGDVVIENLGEGNDTIYSSVSINLTGLPNVENVILSGTDNLSATGNTANNELYGNTGNNVLNGGLGNDLLDGGEGLDTLGGGSGNDVYVVDNAGDSVIENAGEGTDTVYASINYQLGSNVENLSLNGYDNFSGIGNSLDNTLTGNIGNNTLEGGAGNDTLDGSYGDDQLIGGMGNDSYFFDSGFGLDAIRENDSTASNIDSIVFGDLVTASQVTVTRENMDLLLSTTDGDQIRVEGWFTDDAHKIERIEFSDGTVWSTADIRRQANLAPSVVKAISEQIATEDIPFSFSVPANIFTDCDAEVGDRLTFSASLANGFALPSWLSFDANTYTFSGTPSNSEVGALNIKVMATDLAGTSISSVFLLKVLNVNDLPTGAVMVSGMATQGQVLSASNILADADGLGTIGYQWQSSSDGVTWTNIAGATASNCTLTQTEVGKKIRAVASYTDGYGTQESASSTATVAVANLNNAPVVAMAIGAQSATEDAAFSFVVPATTFADSDAGDTLTFSATNSDGSPLPSWLAFDALTYTFSGTPTSTSAATIRLRVTVSDRTGANASTDFVLTIANHIVGKSWINNLYGTDFNDYMEGLGFKNTLKGGIGNDTVIGNCKGSINSLYGDAGNDIIEANGSFNYLNGGTGDDNLQATGSINYLYGDAGNDIIEANGSFNYLNGGASDDNLKATGSINYLYGDAGNDIIEANGSFNYLYGGTGDDTYIVNNRSDRIVEYENEGIDQVQASVSFTLGSNVENLTLSGTAAINGTGNAVNNSITGNSGDNTLTSGDGNDILDGGVGNDTLTGGRGNDLYRFGRGGGQDMIVESDATAGNNDVLALASDVTYEQLWLRHVGNDLVVSIIGGTDSIAIRNWYVGSANHVEQIRSGDGKVLSDVNVDALVQAMATMSAPMSGQTVLPTATRTQLAPVLAANWH